jgi:hypothetical protein
MIVHALDFAPVQTIYQAKGTATSPGGAANRWGPRGRPPHHHRDLVAAIMRQVVEKASGKCRQVWDCASPLALLIRAPPSQSGRGLPQSKTLRACVIVTAK